MSRPADGLPVELGLRAEAARVAVQGDALQMLAVDCVEPTGSDHFINGTADGQKIVARVERGNTVKAGETLPINWCLDDVVAFDLETGRRI